MKQANSIILKAGEKQLSNIASAKAYFSGLTETGATIPLGKVKGLDREWSRHSSDNDGSLFPMRCLVSSYNTHGIVNLQMLLIYSSIGNRKAVTQIHLRLDSKAPKIRILGYNGFGEFVGRAVIISPADVSGADFIGIEVQTLESSETADYDATLGLIF